MSIFLTLLLLRTVGDILLLCISYDRWDVLFCPVSLQLFAYRESRAASSCFIVFKCCIVTRREVTVEVNVVSLFFGQGSLAYQRCAGLYLFAPGFFCGKVPDDMILPLEISAVFPRVVSLRFFEPGILLVLHQFEQDLLTHVRLLWR